MSSEFTPRKIAASIRRFGFVHCVGVRFQVAAPFELVARELRQAEVAYNGRRGQKSRIQISRPERGSAERYMSLGSNAIHALSGKRGFQRILITPAKRVAGQPESCYVVIKGFEDWGALLEWLLALCGCESDLEVVNAMYLEVAVCAVLPPDHPLRRQEPVSDEDGKTVLVRKPLGELSIPGSRLRVPALLTIYRIESDPPDLVKVEVATQVWKGKNQAPQDWFGNIEHDPDTWMARRDALVRSLATHLIRQGLQPTERPASRAALKLYPEDLLAARTMDQGSKGSSSARTQGPKGSSSARAMDQGSKGAISAMGSTLRTIADGIIAQQPEGTWKPASSGTRQRARATARRPDGDGTATRLHDADMLELLRASRRWEQGAVDSSEFTSTPDGGARFINTPWTPKKLFQKARRRRSRIRDLALA